MTGLRPAAIGAPRRGAAPAVFGCRRWELALTAFAVVAAALAVWVTLRADFLAYPGWLAVQKADVILGPVLVGLYWRRKRPDNRLGVLLIILGLVGVPYILESSTVPVLFGVGIFAENAIYLMTALVILSFPSGRLEGVADRLIIAAILVGVVLVDVLLGLTVPDFGPGFSISGCRAACPANGLAVWSAAPSWLSDFAYSNVLSVVLVLIPLATMAVLVRRFVIGSPPRRRALAIGAPIALLFLLMQASYRALFLVSPTLSPSEQPVHSALQWTFAAARAFVWYGFLFALIAAQLFAGRALRRLVRRSLRRPSQRELEAMLREPLGDPSLRLMLREPGSRAWVDAEGATAVAPPEPGPGLALTVIDHDGEPAAALLHDAQLDDDPELLQAAGAVALLAAENAELDAAWKDSLQELSGSRARLVQAADRERRKLERDLHDGAQQRLMAIQIKLRLAEERAGDQGLVDDLEAIGVDAQQAVEELRTLAHGIYPPVLRSFGLADALRSFAAKAPIPVAVEDAGIGRCPRTVETAIYFCAMEAVQNAIKHAGEDARVTITFGRDDGCVRFAIADDGAGMTRPASQTGEGLIGMRDRIGAVGGGLQIVSSPGAGTTVSGTVPLDGVPAGREREVAR